MAEYQRFAAYVYEYRNGKKEKNCGFIKVEVRDGKCTMEVHLQCPGAVPRETCRIYGFVRGDGLLNGIFLGSCEAKADQVEGTIEADSGNLGNSGISFARIGGVLLLTENGGFFGTEWDDQPIRPANFRELPVKKVSAETTENPAGVKEDSAGESAVQEFSVPESSVQRRSMESRAQQESAEMKAEAFENGENMSDTAEKPVKAGGMEETGKSETAGEAAVNPEMKEKSSDESGMTGELEASEILSSAPPNPVPGLKRPMPPGPGSGPRPPMPPNPVPGSMPPNPVPGPRPPMPPNPAPGSRPPMPPSPGSGPRPPISGREGPRSMETAARVSRQFGEEFHPFEDTDLSMCWKIHPRDLPAVSRRLCPMRNNRFLQYGYYNFGHLLLCRRADGKYILGVPGAYDQQERFMAGMFGFPWFKETSYIRVPKGRGGYWYRQLEAVDEG